MKKMLLFLSAIFLLLILLPGCFKDYSESTHRYKIYRPIYKTVKEVRGLIATSPPATIKSMGKITMKDSYLYVVENYNGIHIIDNANPSNPKMVGFIRIPSIRDIAIKNNTLYADMYADLLAIDITDPKNVSVKKVVEKVFQEYSSYKDETPIVWDYVVKDTIVYSKIDLSNHNLGNGVYLGEYSGPWAAGTNGATGANGSAGSTYGTNGSMARFAALSDRLYTVGFNNLGVFNIAEDTKPQFLTRKELDWTVETIFPLADKLFIGTMNGVKIFSITNLDNPTLLGQFAHVRRCDPVVANDKYAFVTLRGGFACGGNTNELHILSIQNITAPSLIKSYTMNSPTGLSLDGNRLFVCDGNVGVKIYDITDVNNLKLITTISDINPYDIITSNKNAIVVCSDGVYQYDYSDMANIKRLSKINK